MYTHVHKSYLVRTMADSDEFNKTALLSVDITDVTCRLFSGNSLLSYVQLQKSLKQHRDPLVNVLTNQRVPTDSSEFNNQRAARLLHKDLPVNFHSISPNYYLCNVSLSY